MRSRPLLPLAAALLLPCGCAQVVSQFMASPVPRGLHTHEGEGFTLHTDLTPPEATTIASFLQDTRAECDRLFRTRVAGDLDVYVFRHREDGAGRSRYAISLPTGSIHIGYHAALRSGGPPIRSGDLRDGVLGDTLRHEVSHQHLYRILGRLPREPWLYEGLPMLIESIALDRSTANVVERPSRAAFLEVAQMLERGVCLMPEHLFDTGWQDFYHYAEAGTYSVAATMVDLLHEEAGRPADLRAFVRDLVARRHAGTLPEPDFRERWRRHVRAGADRQAAALRRDIDGDNPYARLAALEILELTSNDSRWGDGPSLLRRGLAANLAFDTNPDLQARTLPLAVDCVVDQIGAAVPPAEDLRLPIARYLQARHAQIPPETLARWLERLDFDFARFWGPETVATLGWTLGADDPRIVASGLDAMAECGGPEFLRPIQEKLAGADPDTTRRALLAIAGIGGDRARGTLLPCLDSPIERLRDGAALALGELGDPRARAAVTALACNPAGPFRRWAFRALANYADAGEVRFLEETAGGLRLPESAWAVRALALMGTAEARAALFRLFERDELRDRVSDALTDLSHPEADAFLAARLALLSHPAPELLWRLPDDDLRPQAEALRRLACALSEAGGYLESFLVRKRLATLGLRMDDGEALLTALRRIGSVALAPDRQVLAHLAAEQDPAHTVSILVGQLSGNESGRRVAIQCLHRLTDLTFDFHWAAPLPHRQAAVRAWRAWAAEQSGRLVWDGKRGKVRVRQHAEEPTAPGSAAVH